MGWRLFNAASLLLLMVFMSATALPPTHAHGYCPHPKPPTTVPSHPPHIKPPPSTKPPIIYPPPSPPRHPAPYPPAPSPPTCPINALKLGLCLDVLGGLVHVGVGDPVVHVCCPVIQGLLEVEAAVCLCTAIRLKLLNLNIFFTLALEVFATCGKKHPPGFVCPPVHP